MRRAHRAQVQYLFAIRLSEVGAVPLPYKVSTRETYWKEKPLSLSFSPAYDYDTASSGRGHDSLGAIISSTSLLLK
jgi:hypothetical protein